MRTQFCNVLIELTKKDKDIILLTGDLGYSFLEKFQEKFPKQYINCGIAEQNMIGVAAGLAASGKKPYVYSTIPFLIMRPYEQLRDQICYNKNKVVLIGISSSGFLGFSHNIENNEDLKLLKHLPNMNVYLPKTKKQLKVAMLLSHCSTNSSYIRI